MVYIAHLRTSPPTPGSDFLIGTERVAEDGSSPLLATICFAMASLTSCSWHLLMLANDIISHLVNVNTARSQFTMSNCPILLARHRFVLHTWRLLHLFFLRNRPLEKRWTDWQVFFEERMFLTHKEITKPSEGYLCGGFCSARLSVSLPGWSLFPSHFTQISSACVTRSVRYS